MLRLHRIDLLTKLKRAQDQLNVERALAESRRRDLELSKPKDPC